MDIYEPYVKKQYPKKLSDYNNLEKHIKKKIEEIIKYELKRHDNTFNTQENHNIYKKTKDNGRTYEVVNNLITDNDEIIYNIKSIVSDANDLNNTFIGICDFLRITCEKYRLLMYRIRYVTLNISDSKLVFDYSDHDEKKNFEFMSRFTFFVYKSATMNKCLYDITDGSSPSDDGYNSDGEYSKQIYKPPKDVTLEFMKPKMTSLFERLYNNIDIYLDKLPPCIQKFETNKKQRIY